MEIYLPVAEMSVALETIIGLGVAVGMLSSIFGVGGGFLATPFLVFLGVPASFAVGTQAIQLISSSLSGVLGHWRKGNVDFKLGSIMLAGSLVGTVLGILIFKLLQYTGQIDVVINALYVLLLGSIGGIMLYESFKAILKKNHSSEAKRSRFWTKITHGLPYTMTFPRSNLCISIIVPIALGVIGGLMVSVLGIGGGFLLVPAMIYILGMPSSLVIGTSMFQILVSTSLSALLHIVSNNTVDLLLALILMIGSLIGGQIGVRLVKYIKGAPARLALALILLSVCFMLWESLFIEPLEHFTTEIIG
ncbi:MAG TPA: sulfite exporter TauE/SafE family protein [Alphaproteobacteria bacterium]|nr:sulfite exporter TauE/SafE family protein [Alphaproteobacteria bacterium]HOO50646.1 sulfite exporter TauE/SafE family protein [Alphaproteobacteria bacterium]